MEPCAMFIKDCSNVCRKKIQLESKEWSFNDILHPIALYNEISSCTFSLQISTFLLPRKTLQIFSNASQALLYVACYFVLKACLICGPMKIPSCNLASITLGNVCFNRQTLHFFSSIASQRPWRWAAANSQCPKFIFISDLTAKIQLIIFSHLFWKWLPLQF